jgi:hypothetical protein
MLIRLPVGEVSVIVSVTCSHGFEWPSLCHWNVRSKTTLLVASSPSWLKQQGIEPEREHRVREGGSLIAFIQDPDRSFTPSN